MMTFNTPATLMGLALTRKLDWEGGRLLLDFMEKFCGGVMGFGLVCLIDLMEKFCR